MASRQEKNIERAFASQDFATFRIEATKVDEDIAMYVRDQLHDRQHD